MQLVRVLVRGGKSDAGITTSCWTRAVRRQNWWGNFQSGIISTRARNYWILLTKSWGDKFFWFWWCVILKTAARDFDAQHKYAWPPELWGSKFFIIIYRRDIYILMFRKCSENSNLLVVWARVFFLFLYEFAARVKILEFWMVYYGRAKMLIFAEKCDCYMWYKA